MLDVPATDALDKAARVALRRVDDRPERGVVEVVPRGEAGQAVLPGLRPQQPPRLTLAREGAVEAADRLDPDQVAQHEHVQRDLEAELGLDLLSRVGARSRLVVLDDAAGAEGIEIDAVDLSGEREAAEVEAALKLGSRAVGAEGDLEAPRNERQLRLCLAAGELLEVAPQALLELVSLHLGQLEPSVDVAGESVVEALPQEGERLVEAVGLDPLRLQSLRQAREEPVERLVRNGAAQSRVDLAVDRAWVDETLDEPDRGALRERLELGDTERCTTRLLLEHHRMRQPRRPREGRERSIEPALPAVGPRQVPRRLRVAGRQRGDGANPLALARRVLERPDEGGQSPTACPAGKVVGIAGGADVLPERARLSG